MITVTEWGIMMTDIVNIGFSVRTNEIEKGYQRLNKMGDAAEKAETKIGKIAKGAKTAGTAVASMATAGTAAATAIAALMNHLANVERELQASARMAGLTTDQFDAMSFAYRQFGLTVEQVNDIYKDSREKVGQWLTDQTGGLEDFGNVMGMNKDELTKFALEVNNLTGQQLLQRMVDDMEAAGASANEMSFALEGMASEATRMIPALENNGKAINGLSSEYAMFNAAFSLNDEDVQNYADLAKNFDLFLDTAQNGVTKVLSPLAEVMGVLAMEATEFLSALASGSVAAAQKEYSEALEEQLEARRLLGEAQNIPLAFGQDVIDQETKIAQARLDAANDAVAAADMQLEAAKKTAKAQLEINRSSTRNININLNGSKNVSGSKGGNAFVDMFGGTDTVDLFALNQSKAYDKWIESISTTSTKMADLRAEIEKTQAAVAAGDLSSDVGGEYIKDLQQQLKSLEINPFQQMTDGAHDALSAMSGMFESGSKDAQKLAIAMQALNLVQAVGAVLNQGKGDPYTAFGRMAAMAGMVAALGVSIGNLSGGLDGGEAKKAQESQGLDTWGNKSESIIDATEITANATKKLVGINTDMLNALRNLGQALGAAAGLIVRDTNIPQVNVGGEMFDFNKFRIDPFEDILPTFMTDFIGGAIANWLGGESKVANEGIRILGGNLNDLMDDVTVQAFQTVNYKKWKFGSKKSKTQYEDLGDEVGNQVSLVLSSIADSVAAGASQLGIAASDIEERINAFELATIDISLMGLSAEDQQKEIQSVFSKIFDDLAGDVVPFIDEFQKVGEALGETLARIATQTSIAEVMVERFGLTFGDKMADPKAFAEAADNLSTLVGGVDKLAELTSSFTDAFATDQQKFDIYQSSLLEQLSEIGLTLPDTTSGFYDLMQGIDATTKEGQKQIAVLLGLTDTASNYYSLLEKMTDKYRDAAAAMYDMDEATRRISIDSALAAARMGDFSLADELDLSGVAPSMGDFSSAFEYNLARAETAAKLNELADLQSGQVTVQDKQLSVLEDIRDKIGGSDSGVESEIKSLKDQMYKLQTTTNDLLERMTYQLA